MKDKPAAAPESHSQKPKTHLRITDLMSRWVYTRRGIEKLIRRGLLGDGRQRKQNAQGKHRHDSTKHDFHGLSSF